MSTTRLRTAGLASYVAAAFAAAVFLLSYAYGFFRQNLVWDVEEECEIYAGVPFDLDHYASHSDAPWWTFTNPCNAGYDLVPSWVTPTAWASFTLCVILTVTAIGLTFVASMRAAAATS
ncbi:hypothetical protein GHK92_18315 [Nocardioides sp. dk4132]|uniref:hypothetical protein n=1 Tax=unclassified Nocardioides TaxID=2615069 RepID=UPI00129642AC|nr:MULTISPECIES: hypothetical protein [unclassified Nocardioides]MQW77829.1 hypothetical protein [Nocardioides sp. dk4132]QGA08222.1 hypothetical protein GFH29_13020 [Nocardioides sp. dk884]